jgi:anaerobic magnesium-protoporphyrin IX monomethyl ester cyclase
MKTSTRFGRPDICLLVPSQVELGARGLSAFLKSKGFSVTVLFLSTAEPAYREHELVSIARWVKEAHPMAIGISAIDAVRTKCEQLVKLLRRMTSTPIIMGGISPTFLPEHYVTMEDNVVVVRGEGEGPLSEILDALRRKRSLGKILGVTCKIGSTTVRNPLPRLIDNLDELPYEDWLGIQNHYFLNRAGEIEAKTSWAPEHRNHPLLAGFGTCVFLSTVRGCPYSCSYCVNSCLKDLYPGQKFMRKRSIASVVRRVRELVDNAPNLGLVLFFDDDFFARPLAEIQEFCAGWHSLDLPFFAYATPTSLSAPKLAELVDAGLVLLNIGIQSGSDRTNRELYNRTAGVHEALRASRLIKRYVGKGRFGLRMPWFDLIVLNPYERAPDILATIKLLTKLARPYRTDHHALAFFPNAALSQRANRDGLVDGTIVDLDVHDIGAQLNARRRLFTDEEYYLHTLLRTGLGPHTALRDGIVPRPLLNLLSSEMAVRFFGRHPRFVDAANRLMGRPGGKR